MLIIFIIYNVIFIITIVKNVRKKKKRKENGLWIRFIYNLYREIFHSGRDYCKFEDYRDTTVLIINYRMQS